MFYGIQKSMNLKNSSVVSNGKIGLQAHLSTPFRKCFTWIHGTQYPVTKVTSDDVTVITSWWNNSRMLRMSKILRHTRPQSSMKRLGSIKFKSKWVKVCMGVWFTWSQIIVLELDMKLTSKMSFLFHCQQDVYKKPFISVCKQEVNNHFVVHFTWGGNVFDTTN